VAYRNEPDIDLSGSDPETRKELRPFLWPLLFLFLSPLFLRALDAPDELFWAERGLGTLWIFLVYLKVRMSRAKQETAE
jgi:hypothetical protein